MLPDRYGTFVVFATLLVLAPGPDFAVVVKNLLAGRKRVGLLTSLGVVTSNLVHGTFAAFGVGALILRSQVVFSAIRWVGIFYLVYLGVQALRSARNGAYEPLTGPQEGRNHARRGWRQGFLSNITNPKVLAFYVSVLPQFLTSGADSSGAGLVLAYTHAALSLAWLSALVLSLHLVGAWLQRRRVRRVLDAVTGTALVGFGATLAADAR